jgi:hypothetical protein
VDPWATVRRFETGQFTSNDACIREYLAALVRLQRLDRLVPILSSSLPAPSTAAAAAVPQASATPASPLEASLWGDMPAAAPAFAAQSAPASAYVAPTLRASMWGGGQGRVRTPHGSQCMSGGGGGGGGRREFVYACVCGVKGGMGEVCVGV